ncbi:P-loop NTPase family protein [Hamadaea tsunoensis]|uniref:hypothetical protein n=1 Tax=Hamadaea tsunoensis TaxID=53368 RepID=UPI0003FFC996|nr:hypothetical protein [Hamadaea tsunoensis]
MSRSQKIAQILARRSEHATSLEALDSHLAAVGSALTRLDEARLDLLGRIEIEARDRLFDIGNTMRGLEDRLRGERAELARLGVRLGRTTLNVGMVGRARMGKSRFLQSLTGLTAREIPDGDGGFCTGVASLVQHRPGADPSAQVFLHDETTFLREVIEPYYSRLGLGPAPTAVRDFADHPLPALTGDDPRATSEYRHLGAYHANFGAYGGLIGGESPFTVGAERIREYVAQDDPSGSRQYHAFRAVRRVVITTNFPATDVEGLGVIDLPGLGDTNLGDSKILLSALKDDVDVVLFVREPKAGGDDIQDFDIDLYTQARDALSEIPMQRRSFLIINHRRSSDRDNSANARRYQEKVAGSPIQVAGSTVVDCSRPDEVSAAFDPIVDYLLAHVDELDGLLLGDRLRHLAELRHELNTLVAEAGRVAALSQPSSSWFPLFQKLFESAYEQMSTALVKLVKSLEGSRNAPDGEFARAVAEVIRRAGEDDGLPDEEGIVIRAAAVGGRAIAYGQFLNEARAHLSRHFLELDGVLKARVAWMQEQIAQVLCGAGELAPLAGSARVVAMGVAGDSVSDSDGGSATGRDVLLDIAGRVPENASEFVGAEIGYGLHMLADFELAYRGFIQHRIRPCLDGLHSDHPTFQLPLDVDTVSNAKMLEMLEVSYQDALKRCEDTLRDIFAEPNGALFAIVEEFTDRVLRSIGVQREWRVFYEQVRAELWPGPLAELAERSGRFVEWNRELALLRTQTQAEAWVQITVEPAAPARPQEETP